MPWRCDGVVVVVGQDAGLEIDLLPALALLEEKANWEALTGGTTEVRLRKIYHAPLVETGVWFWQSET